jgi:hypothetical protein
MSCPQAKNLHMVTNAKALSALINLELTSLSDSRVVEHIRGLLVEPKPILRAWNYGDVGDKFVCWSVLEHTASNTGIAYCEEGFGPRLPWGLVFLEGNEARTSIGMDSGWFTTFLQAYFDSMAVCDLAIWRVFKSDGLGNEHPITGEASWDETWSNVMAFRESDPLSSYSCSTSVAYERE